MIGNKQIQIFQDQNIKWMLLLSEPKNEVTMLPDLSEKTE